METEESQNIERSVKLCPECDCQMTVNQTREYLTVFHPEIITLTKKISEKVKTIPYKINDKFPSMDCHNLCAAKGIINKLIENLPMEKDSNSLVLIQQLSEKLISVSDLNLISGNHKICMLCGLKFKSTCVTVTHLTLRHPECLALIQFLRCHPLSELKFQKDVIALSRTKTQELIRQITNPTILASRQSFVKQEKLPSQLKHQEFNTKGYVEENTGIPSHSDTQANAISAEVMEKIKQVVEKSPYPDKNNIAVVLVPKTILKTPLENSNLEKLVSSCNKNDKNATVPTTSKLIRFGVEDLKREQHKKEKIAKKEEILRKMLAKQHEKEIKKKVLYWQKKLTRYVMKHQKLLFKFEYDLTNARLSRTSSLSREKLMEEVNCSVKNKKVKKTVNYLLKKLFEAMEQVPAVNETKKDVLICSSCAENCLEKNDQSPQGEIRSCCSKEEKNKKYGKTSFVCKENPVTFISQSVCNLNLNTADPYINTTLITDDKQFFECSCGKLNCLGLHPENFY